MQKPGKRGTKTFGVKEVCNMLNRFNNKPTLAIIFCISLATKGFSCPMDIEASDNHTAEINKKINTLIELIETQDRITPMDAPGLTKPKHIDPIDLYKEIFKAYEPLSARVTNPGKVHIEGYAKLAKSLLVIIIKRAIEKECTNRSEVEIPLDDRKELLRKSRDFCLADYEKEYITETISTKPIISTIENDIKKAEKYIEFAKPISAFEKEISRVQRENAASYRWFVNFSDQLSLLTSKLLYESYNNTNTLYSHYFFSIDSTVAFPDFSEEKYIINSPRVDFVMSPPALLNQFPDIFMMPYLFELGPIDFLNLTLEGNKLFWPCGMTFAPVIADGLYKCPRMFFAHDMHHLGLLLASMLCPHIEFDEKDNIAENPQLVARTFYLAKNLFNFYCLSQHEIYNAISKMKEGEEKQLYSFYAFNEFHEDIKTGARLVQGILGLLTPAFSESEYYDDKYYKPLLPNSISKLSTQEACKSLENGYKAYTSHIHKNISAELLKYYESMKIDLCPSFSVTANIYDIKGRQIGKIATIDLNFVEKEFHMQLVFERVCSNPNDEIACKALISWGDGINKQFKNNDIDRYIRDVASNFRKTEKTAGNMFNYLL